MCMHLVSTTRVRLVYLVLSNSVVNIDSMVVVHGMRVRINIMLVDSILVRGILMIGRVMGFCIFRVYGLHRCVEMSPMRLRNVVVCNNWTDITVVRCMMPMAHRLTLMVECLTKLLFWI